MPKLPRDVGHDEVVRFLRKRGWRLAGGKRHTVLRRGPKMVAVPRHGNIATGTLRAILDQAGVPPEEWAGL